MNQFRSIISAILLGSCLFAFNALAWTIPTTADPNTNTAPPIHSGPQSQTKSGSLSVDVGVSSNGGIRMGNSSHLNWGTTGGQGGYGLRASGGVMQYKNNGDPDWTPFGAGFSSHQQYGFTNISNWSICKHPSVTNITCEILGTVNQAIAAGWTSENMKYSGGQSVIWKEIPGQSTSGWKVCTMNAYTTPYDWNTLNYVIRRPDGKWYVYFGQLNYGVSAMHVITNCWR